MVEMLITLNRASTIPIYLQIADAIHAHIDRWQIAPKTRMPSTRDLSLQLGVSKFTVEKAYQALTQQGILKASKAAGTVVGAKHTPSTDPVRQNLHDSKSIKIDESRLSNYGRRVLATELTPSSTQHHPSIPTFDSETTIPRWTETVSRIRKEFRQQIANDPAGQNVKLEKLVANYVARSRGINCSHKQILLFSSKFAALDVLARILISPGETIAIENPSCLKVRAIFKANGAILKPISSDSRGMQVEDITSIDEDSRFAYICPTSNALGQQLSDARRQTLLAWAERTSSYIIEDDCGHELRYNMNPIAALKAADSNRSVIYLSDFDDVMLTGFDCAYLVLPENLVSLFEREQMLTQRATYSLGHAAMALFMSEGNFERHVRRLRLKYSNRRKMLIENFNSKLGRMASIVSSNRTSLIVLFDESTEFELILDCAIASGLPLKSTASHYLCHARPNEFQINFAYTPEDILREQLESFANSLVTLQEQLAHPVGAPAMIAHQMPAYSLSR